MLPPNLCTSVQSVGVFVGGYGILPYPRRPLRGCTCLRSALPLARARSAPTKHSCTSINPPTEFTEFTEASGRGYSPTDFTDAHRSLGCVLPPNLCTSVQSVGVFVGGYGILPYPRRPLPILPQNSQNPHKRLSENILPQNSQNSRKLLAEDILPQISQMPTD